jgi:hypothetical protein
VLHHQWQQHLYTINSQQDKSGSAGATKSDAACVFSILTQHQNQHEVKDAHFIAHHIRSSPHSAASFLLCSFDNLKVLLPQFINIIQ